MVPQKDRLRQLGTAEMIISIYQFSSIVTVILFELMAVLRPMAVPAPNAIIPVLLLTVNVLKHIYSGGTFAVDSYSGFGRNSQLVDHITVGSNRILTDPRGPYHDLIQAVPRMTESQ